MGMHIDPRTPLADLVLEHPECAAVLRQHRIDFCCRGDLTLSGACADGGLDGYIVMAELERAAGAASNRRDREDVRAMSTPELIAHIVERHHGTLGRSMGPAGELAAELAAVHGAEAPRLVQLDAAYRELVRTIAPHLEHEEAVFFPALLAGGEDELLLRREIEAMRSEHLAVGSLLARIRRHADDYHVPDTACATYRALFAELEAMEDGILNRIHLENHVLLPRFAPPAKRSSGALYKMLVEEHLELEFLLDRAVADPRRFDFVAFEQFRARLLRHIGIEEKILLPELKRRRGSPWPLAKRLRVEHGALASLLVPTPDAELVGEIRVLLRAHNPLEEDPGGLYDACEDAAGSAVEDLVARARAAPVVPTARHYDGRGVHRNAEAALAAAERSHTRVAR